MKKWLSFLFTTFLLIGVLVGCGSNDEGGANNAPADEENQTEQVEQRENGSFPVTITDALGEEVVIEKEPERIISLAPSNTEISFALNLSEKIVGVTDYDDYPAEAAEKEKIGSQELNIEKIISLYPDLVLAHESGLSTTEEGLEQLKEAGITVFVVKNAESLEETYESIETIGEATGKVEEAKTLINEMDEKVAEIKEKAKNVTETKKVLFEIDPTSGLYVAGKNTFLDEMLSIINAENIIDEEGWLMVDQESIISKNPDVIITTYGSYVEGAVEQVKERDGWQDITAVKDDAVYDIESDLVTLPGPRLVEGVEEVAKVVYPEIFGE